MNNIEQLFALLELFMQKPEEDRQRKAWNMFCSFFILFPPSTVEDMINDLSAFSQARDDVSEQEKLKLLAFCKYLNVTLKMLNTEVNERIAVTDTKPNIFSDPDHSL
ncbi:hypothetical protein [Chitinophaga sp.]|uniref:hypothetical protein n=1 Tax=Chitinophaga sp. TaxID=1869181 RepID=UPI002F92ADB3